MIGKASLSNPQHPPVGGGQDVLLLALGDVWHAAELAVVVVILVLGMLPLDKLCKEKSPDPKRLLVWTGHSLMGLLALYFLQAVEEAGFSNVPSFTKTGNWTPKEVWEGWQPVLERTGLSKGDGWGWSAFPLTPATLELDGPHHSVNRKI